MLLFAIAATAAVSEQTRSAIDQAMGRKGTYIAEEGVYKIIIAREDATIVQDYQTLSPNLGLHSWVAFTSGIHHEAVLTGQFLLLDDEVNPVLDVILAAGLNVSGLAESCHFGGKQLYTLDFTGVGAFGSLAVASRKGFNEIQRVRKRAAISSRPHALPSIPIESSITPAPLDAVLSMRGTVLEGVYKAAIGSRILLNCELIGREMGMSTWVSIAGSDGHAFAQGEFIERATGLNNLLRALRLKDLNVVFIRNHTLDEHPQSVFVRFRGEESAIQLAKAMRYALDVQVGIISPQSEKKI